MERNFKLVFISSVGFTAGLAAGVLLGGVAAVPDRAWPDIQARRRLSL